jgi:Protein of unknown function (DUF1566)
MKRGGLVTVVLSLHGAWLALPSRAHGEQVRDTLSYRVVEARPVPPIGPIGPPSPGPGPSLPPHFGETDRQIIVKTLDAVSALTTEVNRLGTQVAQLQQELAVLRAGANQRLDAVGAQMRLPVAWSAQLMDNQQRWEVVLNGEALLDKETGLVWDRQIPSQLGTYRDAIQYCFNRRNGGRQGWRLPTPVELTSLAPLNLAAVGDASPFGRPPGEWARRVYWTSVTAATGWIPDPVVRTVFVVSDNWEVSQVPLTADHQPHNPRRNSVICVRGGADPGLEFP